MIEKFGKYQLERKLAVGGMAEIFLATHSGPEGFKKHLAIKRILPYLNDDSDFVTMFLDEARLVARFNHPNIVQIFELGKVEGSYFLAMEFINGVSVSRLMKACRKKNIPIPLEYGVKIVSGACEGLDYAHEFTDPDGKPLNLIHRDVSPQNLMVSYDGVIKVLDFGIAKAASNSYQTRTSSLKGKAAYMSPEQIIQKGGLDKRSDVFSLGIVLFELATGHRPFRGDTELELMMSIVKKPAPDPRTFDKTIPPQIVKILAKALEKNRSRRYQSCFEMKQDLEEFLLNRRIMVDNHTLGSFARQVLPPGDIGVGSSNLTPSSPSFIEVAKVETGSVIPPRTSTSRRILSKQDNKSEDLPTQHTPSSQLRPVMESASIPIDIDVSTVRDGEIFDGPERKRQLDRKKIITIISLLLVTLAGLVFVFQHMDSPQDTSKNRPAPSQKKSAHAQVDKQNMVTPKKHQAPTPVEKPKDHTGTDQTEPVSDDKRLSLVESPGNKIKTNRSTNTQNQRTHKRRKKKASATNNTRRVDRSTKVAVTPRHGNLLVDSRPWTNITIDGTSYGTTPLGPVELKTGIHKLVLANKSKGILLKKSINILAGQTQKVREKFGRGTLMLFVKPFGKVFVDGESQGITPLDNPIKLYEGTHRIRVECPKTGKSAAKTIHINTGDAKVLKFDLR